MKAERTYAVIIAILFSCAVFSQPCASTATCTLGATSSVSGLSCSSVGSAIINVTGGLAPYTYSWSPNISSTNSVSNLSPGNYAVTVSDAGGSGMGPELVVNGDFTAGNTGFSSTYTYCNSSLCLYPAQYYSVGSNPQFYHNQFWGSDHTTGTGNFMIINADDYLNMSIWSETVTVTPNTNYVFSAWLSSMNTFPPATLQFSINGNFVGNPFTAPSQINQWNQFCATWNSGSSTTAVISIVNKSLINVGNDCGLDDISFRGVVPCSTTVTFTVPPSSTFNISATANPASCGANDGSATVTTNGGIAPFTYLWLTNPVQTTPTVNNLSGGTYSVIVTDANGCAQQQSVTIAAGGNVPLADFTTSMQTATLPNSTFDFTNNSLGATTWMWDFGDGTSSTLQNPPSHTYADTGTYCVTLIVTTGNAVCVDTVVHCVEVTAEFSFYIPNAFTPNGDWNNEFFFGKSRGVKDYTIRLFDRWGNLIWDCHHEGYRGELDQNPAEGLSSMCKWNGTVTNGGNDLNGKSNQLVQEDVYVWKVELTDVFNKEHKYIGHVSVVR